MQDADPRTEHLFRYLLATTAQFFYSTQCPWNQPNPCKVKNHQCREPCRTESNSRHSKYACIVEAHESTRKRLERILPKDHERSHCRKGIQLTKSSQDCAQFYHRASSNENDGCQGSGEQGMGKAREIASIANDQSKKQKRGHQRGTERATNSSFCYADGHLSSQDCGVGTNISEGEKAGLYSEVT